MPDDNTRRLYIETYGCQMNAYDSERMAEALAPLGFVAADAPEDADLAIVNTCHIREKATEKLYSELGRLRQVSREKVKRGGKALRIGVAGCVAQAEGEELLARADGVDLLVGPQSYHRLGEMTRSLLEQEGSNAPQVSMDFPAREKFQSLPPRSKQRAEEMKSSAFLSVQEGCDKFCSFCVVPYTRGAEFSREVCDIEEEARRLMDAGVKEITLLGQNVNAYHGRGTDGTEWRLGRLLNHLANLDGLERLRYTTSHPRDMDDELIRAHAENEKLMPYLHLPVQSGSDAVLHSMNRRHSSADYLRIIEKVRAARPDIAVSSDFIVGFPGETEDDFEATLSIVEEVGFARAYSFVYSARPGTPAADVRDPVPLEVKRERLARLQTLLRRQQRDFNKMHEGKRLPVLLERDGRLPSQLVGRSPYFQPVYVQADSNWRGRIADVHIRKAHENSLEGEPLAASS
ncbi:MAG: tRNA (N6-isopentenyl adenosine(37)-C2)-methylthiotransferase MiaB [Hyphomicrobiales bacterium]|nr:tRNA (N6-isopentenyl adenosine(37)-C2)-methylthiotransferase MiaB [Hyphomicrobiales bacterium]